MVRTGGLLVIDHRNYDHILSTGCAPPGKNIYYKVSPLGGRGHSARCEPGLQGPTVGDRGSRGPHHCPQSDLTKDVTTSVLTVNNKAHMVTLDYTVQVPAAGQDGPPSLR